MTVTGRTSRHRTKWATSQSGRSRARGTCVRGIIFMRKDGNLSVDRVRGGASESCRTIRLHLPLNRVGDFAKRKVSSTRYMCPWAHFCAYGREFDGRSCPRWCIRELSYNSAPPASQSSGRFRPAEGIKHEVHVSVGTFPHFYACGREFVGRSCPRWCMRELSYNSAPPASQSSGRFRPAEGIKHEVHVSVGTFPCVWTGIVGRSCPRWCMRELSYNSAPPASQSSGRFRPAEGIKHEVHVSVGTFPCVWTGICRSIVSEVVHQRVVVQFVSTCLSTEWATSQSGRSRARGTCVRGHIFVRMDGNLTVDRVRGGA